MNVRDRFLLLGMLCFTLSMSIPVPGAARGKKADTGQAAPADKKDQAIAAYHTAMDDLILNGDRAKARAGFAAAIALDAANLPAHFNRGLLDGLDEKWDDALAEFNTVKQTDAESPYAKRADDMIANIQRIQDADKTPEGKTKRQWEDAVMTARILIEQGQYKAAFAELTTATQLVPGKPEPYVMGARVLVRQQLYDDAAALLQTAVSHAADADKPDLNALIVAVTKEQAHQAALHDKYITLTKAGGQALADKKYDVAADSFSQAAALFPLRPEAQFRAASAEALNGDVDKALGRLGKLRHSGLQAIADKAAGMQRSLWVADALVNPPGGSNGPSLADILSQICILANAHANNWSKGEPAKDVSAGKNEENITIAGPASLTATSKNWWWIQGNTTPVIHETQATVSLADLNPDDGSVVPNTDADHPGFITVFGGDPIGFRFDFVKTKVIDSDGPKEDVQNIVETGFDIKVIDQASANQLKGLMIQAIKLARAMKP